MTPESIRQILEAVRQGKQNVDAALEQLKDLPFSEMGFAKVDNHRQLRTGYPEVIFCSGKTLDQCEQIIGLMYAKNSNILATRASEELYSRVKSLYPETEYHPAARAVVIRRQAIPQTKSYISIVTAGTADIPIAEEAAVTAELFGNRVERIFDVGVAGIHRLYSRLELIRGGRVIIAVAGMEGALPGVLGGLVDKPVIAVPTSVGYGANFSGLSALLTMLNSCAAGISVVNIDNGFGAGYLASLINRPEEPVNV
ncbi:MAG: nickel pincer cofactor biosynthesis protein LarB [Bacteroidales bacterium]|jgi:NCAIR mutase (PurE)-related protein|nr:nickel pincer cofactor biosynthesis protein LarB [Bacteroidales bacterium]